MPDIRSVDLFEKQMMLERDTAKSVRRLAAKTKNSIPKVLLKGIELDSTKHAHMYATLMDLSAGAVVSKVESYEMRKELERHVANEKSMLFQAQRIARSLRDPRMKPLLQVILADEKVEVRKHFFRRLFGLAPCYLVNTAFDVQIVQRRIREIVSE